MCNTLYYDPANRTIIDPWSGRGVVDATRRRATCIFSDSKNMDAWARGDPAKLLGLLELIIHHQYEPDAGTRTFVFAKLLALSSEMRNDECCKRAAATLNRDAVREVLGDALFEKAWVF